MKVVFEDGELERLGEIDQRIRKDRGWGLYDDVDREYALTFTVTNPAIANYILPALLNNKIDEFDMGINVTSLQFATLADKNGVAEQLHNAVDQILGIERYSCH